MADKEKLIEAVGSFKFPIESCGCAIGEYIVPYSIQEPLVDHLIANSVVISNSETATKWIPVTERLPKAFRAVLAYCPNGGNIYEVYLNTRSEWHFFDETVAGAVLQNAVTHWMPLPEPPKGE